MPTKRILIILFAAGWLLPLGFALGYSLLYSLGLAGLLQEGFTLNHWAELFQGEFLKSILYSFWVAGASTVLVLLISFGLLFTSQKYLREPFLYRTLYLPLTRPPIVLAFSMYHMLSGAGFLSRIAFHLNLVSAPGQFPALVQDPYAVGIILAHLLIVFPFFLLVLLNLYEQQKLDEMSAVASALGAGKTMILLKIQIPILLRGLFPLIALYFIFFMGAYEIPLLLGQSSPQMISVLILEKLQRFNLADIPVAHSMAVWYALLCMATISWLLAGYKRRFEW